MAGIEGLGLRQTQQACIERFVQACQADERVLAAFLGGSIANGTNDEFSDIDLCVITLDEAFEEFYIQRSAFLASLGDLVFLEDFGNPDTAFFILADGTEGELNISRESRLDHIHSGPFRILLDKKRILAEAAFPERKPDEAHQLEILRSNMIDFWHEMSHFITAIGRNKLWWARGQLGALRSICVNLARLQNDFSDEGAEEEPYFKIEYAMPVEKLSPLEDTFCPMQKDAMLYSAQKILKFYKLTAQSLAQMHGIAYPHRLEAIMLERLEKLYRPIPRA
jgi:predicted nucleotidyltransferase